MVLAFLMTPTMSLDRFCLTLTLGICMMVGAYLKEKELVEQYGTMYIEYQNKVPAFLPLRIFEDEMKNTVKTR